MLKKLFTLFTFLTSCLAADIVSDKKTLIADHTEFAFSLYPGLKNESENIVFSPYSIATCLSMVYIGARAQTQNQMQSVLHLNLERKQLAKTANALYQSLLPAKKEENPYHLNIANAIWLDQGTFLLTDFRYAIEEQFKAKLGMVNFSNSSSALLEINDWTSQQTQGKIANLFTAEDINESTRLVLTNAVYFQGAFQSPFPPGQSGKSAFYSTPDKKTEVDMMRQTVSTLYFENDLLHAIALPIRGINNSGSNLAFFILFPKSATNFPMMFQELSGSYDEWIASLKYEQIDLSIPKFTFTQRFDLAKPLQDLGMEDAFDSSANFAGIDGMRDLFLNKVVHEAFFSIDENGISAAAGSGASMSLKATPAAKPTVNLVVDHPFLFFLIDLKSHEMLFMGKVSQLGEVQ